MRSLSFSRVALSFAAAAIVVAALSSCGGNDLLQIDQSWTQQSVAGKVLPDTVPNSDPVIVITSGDAQINQNGHYTFTFNGTTDGVQGVVATDAGTWGISHATFFFKSGGPNNKSYIAALAQGTINVQMPGTIVHSTSPSVDMLFIESP
ncbi:MAG TPA: hypothetical protein VGO46_11730 [Gemmatimonadaceae bacterium]|nr:hypothetical protein [Gemmatimonadaceae bacterium]